MPRWGLGPLGARLALAFIVVALVAIAVLGGLTLMASRSEVADLVDRQRDADVAQIAATLEQAYAEAGGWEAADPSGAFALAASARADLVVLGSGGEVVATQPASMSDLMNRMHGRQPVATDEDLGEARQATLLVEGVPVGAAQLRFHTGGLPAPEREVRNALARTVVAGAGIAALVAVAVAVYVSRRVTRPVTSLTAAARRIEAGDWDVRAGAEPAPGELGELATAFDQMTETLRREDALRRALVADVAHELRTPATILRASFEEMVDGLADPTPERLGSLHEEVLRLGRVIEDLGALASAEAAGLHLERSPVDMAAVAAQAAGSLRSRFDDAGVTLSTTLVPVTVVGDAGRLHQVVVNLLTNALKFTPRWGTATLEVGPDDDGARLGVSDTGPGIPEVELPHVFERFWRGPGSEGSAGSGIGLAIVAELVRAHGGEVSVESAPGQGTTFTVRLPVRS